MLDGMTPIPGPLDPTFDRPPRPIPPDNPGEPDADPRPMPPDIGRCPPGEEGIPPDIGERLNEPREEVIASDRRVLNDSGEPPPIRLGMNPTDMPP